MIFRVRAIAGWWGLLLLCCQRCKLTINILLWLQWVPLGDGAARISQHVWPVLKTQAGSLATNKDLPNGIVLTYLVIIKHCDNYQDFLREKGREKQEMCLTVVGLQYICFTISVEPKCFLAIYFVAQTTTPDELKRDYYAKLTYLFFSFISH